MSFEAHLRAIIREEVTAALAAIESAVKSGKAKTKAGAAPESSQPAATLAAGAAAAPAPAAVAATPPPAQSQAVPTPPLTSVNKATQTLASVDRESAVKILTQFGATVLKEGKTIVNTSLLKAEQYQAVIDAMEERKAAIDAAATQVSLV
jgi:hypothetical protein